MITWVLVANAAEAKLYYSSNLHIEKLEFFKEYFHPESRKKAAELVSDRPGHYKTELSPKSAFAEINPKKVEAENFAQELVAETRKSCDLDDAKNVIIVVPDSFYQLMAKHFKVRHPNQEKIIHIAKDYTKKTLPELIELLNQQLFS